MQVRFQSPKICYYERLTKIYLFAVGLILISLWATDTSEEKIADIQHPFLILCSPMFLLN